MKKLKLKKRKKNKLKIILTSLFLIILISFYFIYSIGKKINSKLLNYSELEITKISKTILMNSIDDSVMKYLEDDSLFKISKSDNDDIQLISLDAKVMNDILTQINNNIINCFENLENGKSNIVELNKNILINNDLPGVGIVLQIPFGVIFNNSLLTNIGTKIPVRINIDQNVSSTIKTKLESYGINSTLLNLYAYVTVSETLILPLSSKTIEVNSEVPLVVKLIQGNIPNYYFDKSLN